MRFSIITACLNAEDTIAHTRDSIMRQTMRSAIEWIVVDGGSIDATRQIVEDARGTVDLNVISEPDDGLYCAMNKGIRAAKGEWIGFLNADDFFASDDVVDTLAKCAAESNPDCIYGDIDLVDRNNVALVRRRWQSGPFSKGRMRVGWHPPHPAFYARRECFSNGAFREDLRISADYEMMLRFLFVRRLSCRYIPKTFVHMRSGGASNGTLRGILRGNLEVYRSWGMNGMRGALLAAALKPLRKIAQIRLPG